MRLLASFLLIALFTSSCKRQKPPAKPETPEEKTATYHIFATRDYNSTPYGNWTAELRLQLRIIDYRTGEQKLMWDSLLPVRRVMEFPLQDQKLTVIKSRPVLNSHQKLNASYSVIYRDGQHIQQEGRSDEAGPGTHAIVLQAGL